jgi:pantoate kinase
MTHPTPITQTNREIEKILVELIAGREFMQLHYKAIKKAAELPAIEEATQALTKLLDEARLEELVKHSASLAFANGYTNDEAAHLVNTYQIVTKQIAELQAKLNKGAK